MISRTTRLAAIGASRSLVRSAAAAVTATARAPPPEPPLHVLLGTRLRLSLRRLPCLCLSRLHLRRRPVTRLDARLEALEELHQLLRCLTRIERRAGRQVSRLAAREEPTRRPLDPRGSVDRVEEGAAGEVTSRSRLHTHCSCTFPSQPSHSQKAPCCSLQSKSGGGGAAWHGCWRHGASH